MAGVYSTQANNRVLKLLPCGVKTILDIGCGTGKLGHQLSELGLVVDGITVNKTESEIASRVLRHVHLFDIENGLPELSETYDVVILSHVMEHIAKPDQMLTALGNVLKDSGHVVCAIPNMLFLYNRLKLLFGRVEYEEYGLMDYTHVRWYTRKSLTEVFERFGFEVETFLPHGYVPLGPLRKILGAKGAEVLDKHLIKAVPGLLACEFAFRFRLNRSD